MPSPKHIATSLAAGIALTATCGTTALAQQDESIAPTPPSVLAILAHPDDEIMIAPVLARVARGGGEVAVVFATSGDAGPGVSDLAPGEELADLREDEARCAAFALGLPEPIFWGFDDGKLATMARAPDSAAQDLQERIAALIALQKPETIMTWGPDGGYGHADHRMVSALVAETVQAMENDRPDLLYVALPTDRVPDIPEFSRWATTHPSLVTDRIRYEPPEIEATVAAIDCYESQFTADARAALPRLLHEAVWRGTVHFRLAFQSTRRRD